MENDNLESVNRPEDIGPGDPQDAASGDAAREPAPTEDADHGVPSRREDIPFGHGLIDADAGPEVPPEPAAAPSEPQQPSEKAEDPPPAPAPAAPGEGEDAAEGLVGAVEDENDLVGPDLDFDIVDPPEGEEEDDFEKVVLPGPTQEVEYGERRWRPGARGRRPRRRPSKKTPQRERKPEPVVEPPPEKRPRWSVVAAVVGALAAAVAIIWFIMRLLDSQ